MFTLLISMSAVASFKPPADWEKWIDEARQHFQEKFSVPTITHHIYLEKAGDSTYLDLVSGSYPRYSNSCDNCDWKVQLLKDGGVEVTNKKKNIKISVPENKETAVLPDQGIYVSRHNFKNQTKVRLFLYNLNQKELAEKRKREFFKYNEGYVVMGRYKSLKEVKKVTVQRSDGSKKNYNIIAEIEYDMPGSKTPGKLSVYNFGENDDFKNRKLTMLLYRDYSNGNETYGAGRFLNVQFDKKMSDLKSGDPVKLDFNYSYNPPCAFSTGFHCPLPQDTVKLKVLAGEKYKKI